MSNKLPPCPCGSVFFYKRTRVTGYWNSTLKSKPGGNYEIEGDGDDLRDIKEPKFIRCAECKKRHPNPDFFPR